MIAGQRLREEAVVELCLASFSLGLVVESMWFSIPFAVATTRAAWLILIKDARL